jgi:hypothetical protein
MASLKIIEVTDSSVYVVVTRDDNSTFGQMIPDHRLKDGEISSLEEIVREMLGEQKAKPTTDKLKARKNETIVLEAKR